TPYPENVTQLVRSVKPTLVILDYHMPSASGAQVLQRLRTLPEGERIPVVFISASPPQLVEANVGEGANVKFLPKPVKLENLRLALGELILAYEKEHPDAGAGDSGIQILK